MWFSRGSQGPHNNVRTSLRRPVPAPVPYVPAKRRDLCALVIGKSGLESRIWAMFGKRSVEASARDGATPESKTVRVIAAFPAGGTAPMKTVKAAPEAVTYKKTGDLEIYADVYYPVEGEELADRKMPVGS